MAIRKSMLIGEPVLRETVAQVDGITSVRTRQVVQDLIETMRAQELIVLTAPQISESVQIFVSEIRETKYRTALRMSHVYILTLKLLTFHVKQSLIGKDVALFLVFLGKSNERKRSHLHTTAGLTFHLSAT